MYTRCDDIFRFSPKNILPSNVSHRCSREWEQHVTECAAQYNDDLPSPFVLSEELKVWKAHWESELRKGNNVPNTVKSTLVSMNSKRQWFPNIYTILVLIGTCPGTSVASERFFSKLRQLKNYLRNAMGNDRLTGLALLNIHFDIDIDMDELMQIFCREFKQTLFKRDIFIDESLSR